MMAMDGNWESSPYPFFGKGGEMFFAFVFRGLKPPGYFHFVPLGLRSGARCGSGSVRAGQGQAETKGEVAIAGLVPDAIGRATTGGPNTPGAAAKDAIE